MDPFTAIAMGTQIAGGLYKTIDGIVNAKAAREKMKRLEAQALPLNAFEALQVSTEAQEMQVEQIEKRLKDQTEALRGAGTRAIVGGIGTLNESAVDAFRRIGADMDEKMDSKNRLIAEEQANIYGVGEARYRGQLSQAGAQFAASKNQIFSGIGDMGGAVVSARNMKLKQDAIDAGLDGLGDY